MSRGNEAHRDPAGTPASDTAGTDLEAAWATFAAFFEHAPDPALWVSEAGVVERATHGFGGEPASSVVGKKLVDLVTDETRTATATALDAAFAAWAPATIDLSIGNILGARWYATQILPVARGTTRGLVLVSADVTDRRLEEERLRRSERLMIDTQGVAHLGTWEWDPRLPHARWSNELFSIYGLESTKHVPSYPDYLERVHPDDRQRVMDATDRVFKNFEPYSHDERVFRPSGEQRYLHTWAEAILDASGNLDRLVGVCLDITEQKRIEAELAASEARFRTLFEQSAIGIALLDEDGRFIDVNDALQHTLFRSKEELTQLRLQDIALDEAAVELPPLLAALFADKEKRVHASDLRLTRAHGESVWVSLTLSVARGRAETPPFIIAVVLDMSARKEAESRALLAESRFLRIQELEGVSEWKTRVLDVTSHELKNPLTPLMLQLDMLRSGRRGELAPEQKKSVDIACVNAERLRQLLFDLSDMARIEQRRLSVTLDDVDVEKAIVRVAGFFSAAAEEWQIALTTTTDPHLFARADPLRFEQILYNLLSNALKFTPKLGSIAIEASRTGDTVHIVVSDSGPGMTPAQASRLFQAFSQVHDAGAAREPGMGLGLFISKHLAEAQGGRLWLEESASDVSGTRFHLELAVAAPEAMRLKT
jgi:PAS domain S-box-containing protein